MARTTEIFRELSSAEKHQHRNELKFQGGEFKRTRPNPTDTPGLTFLAQQDPVAANAGDNKPKLPCFKCAQFHVPPGSSNFKCKNTAHPNGKQWQQLYQVHRDQNNARKAQGLPYVSWNPKPSDLANFSGGGGSSPSSVNAVSDAVSDLGAKMATFSNVIKCMANKIESRPVQHDVRLEDESKNDGETDSSLSDALAALNGFSFAIHGDCDPEQSKFVEATPSIIAEIESIAPHFPTVLPSRSTHADGTSFAVRNFDEWRGRVQEIEDIAPYFRQVYSTDPMLHTPGVIINGRRRQAFTFITDGGADDDYMDWKDGLQLVRDKLAILVQRTPRRKNLVGCGNDPTKTIVDYAIATYLDDGAGPELMMWNLARTNGFALKGLMTQKRRGIETNPRDSSIKTRFIGHGAVITNDSDVFHVNNDVVLPESQWCYAKTYPRDEAWKAARQMKLSMDAAKFVKIPQDPDDVIVANEMKRHLPFRTVSQEDLPDSWTLKVMTRAEIQQKVLAAREVQMLPCIARIPKKSEIDLEPGASARIDVALERPMQVGEVFFAEDSGLPGVVCAVDGVSSFDKDNDRLATISVTNANDHPVHLNCHTTEITGCIQIQHDDPLNVSIGEDGVAHAVATRSSRHHSTQHSLLSRDFDTMESSDEHRRVEGEVQAYLAPLRTVPIVYTDVVLLPVPKSKGVRAGPRN